MAENDVNKKVLIDVVVSDNNTVQKLRSDIKKLENSLEDLQKEQRKLNTESEESSSRNADLTAQIAALTAQINANQKALSDVSASRGQEITQLSQLGDRLAATAALYERLGKEGQNSVVGQKLAKEMADLRSEQEKTKKSTDDATKSTQNYDKAAQNLIVSSRSLTGRLVDMAKSAGEGSLSFGALASSVGSLTRALLKFLASPVGLVLAAIAAAVGVATFAFNQLGDAIARNEDRSRAWQKAIAPFTAAVNVTKKAFGDLAEELTNFGGALTQSLIQLDAWVISLFAGRDASKAYTDAITAQNELIEAQISLVNNQRAAEIDLANNRARQTELNAVVYDKENQTIADRRAAISELRNIAEEAYNIRVNLANEEIAVLEKLIEVQDQDSEANRNRLNSLKASVIDVEASYQIALRTANRFETELVREERRREATAARDRQTAAKKELLISLENDRLRLQQMQSGFDKELSALRQYYDQRAQDIQRRLETEVGLTDIARRGLLDQIELLKTEEAEQTKELFASWNNSLLSAAGVAAEAQINEINRRYEEAIRNLQNAPAPERLAGESDENFQDRLSQYRVFLYDRAQLEMNIEKEKNQEIAEIRYAYERQVSQRIEAETERQYGHDLELYARNETERLNVLEASLRAQIAKKQEANIVTYAEENQLEEIAAQRRLAQYEIDAREHDASMRRKYETTREYLLAEYEAYEGNYQMQAQLALDLRDLEREYLDERISYYQEYANAAVSVANSVSTIIRNNSQKELNALKADNSEALKDLKARYNAGLISQEYYNAEQERLSQDLADKQLEIEIENAKREKKIKLFEIAIDTIAGIAKAVAASPLTFGLPFSAFVAATGAAQAIALASTPLPVAEKGMYVKGRRHSQGGTIVEAEDGEVIINRNSVSMFPGLLSEINRLGGGVAFANPSVDGGFSGRRLSEEVDGGNAGEIINALQNANFLIDFEQFANTQKSYINTRAKGNIF